MGTGEERHLQEEAVCTHIKSEQGEFKDYSHLKMVCILLEEKLKSGEIEQYCLDCDDCMTFVENRSLVYGYLFEGKDLQWVKESEQYVRKARGQDQILRHLHASQANPEDFN